MRNRRPGRDSKTYGRTSHRPAQLLSSSNGRAQKCGVRFSTTRSRKPSSATVHFSAGPNAGVTVVWNGGNTVVAHRGAGFTALFKKTFSLNNPRATTIRGSSIDQLSFAAILAHSQGTPGIVSQDVGPTILDIPTEAVTLVPTSSVADTGLTCEVVDIFCRRAYRYVSSDTKETLSCDR